MSQAAVIIADGTELFRHENRRGQNGFGRRHRVSVDWAYRFPCRCERHGHRLAQGLEKSGLHTPRRAFPPPRSRTTAGRSTSTLTSTSAATSAASPSTGPRGSAASPTSTAATPRTTWRSTASPSAWSEFQENMARSHSGSRRCGGRQRQRAFPRLARFLHRAGKPRSQYISGCEGNGHSGLRQHPPSG
jgi:hypothetical protein